MKISSPFPVLLIFLMLLSACGESQTDVPESKDDLSQENSMVRIDKSTIDSMKAADSGAAARGDTSSATETGPFGQAAVWLGAFLVASDGKAVVESVVKPVEGVDLKEGDVIESVGGTPVATPQEVKKQYGQVEIGAPVRLTMRRAGTKRAVVFARPDSSEVPDLRMTVMQ